LITQRVAAGKTTKILCGNIKVLLFEDEKYKGPIFVTLAKKLRVFM
jgi:hypothetical protein